MSTMFGGGRASQASTPPTVASALRIQRSVNGAVVAVVYGTARISGNLLWYGDFQANPVRSGGKSGGKGGIAGSSSAKGQVSSYTYQASFAVGLCAGPIQTIGQVWATTSTPETLPSLGGTVALMTGADGQSPWGYLATAHPDQALGYNGLAYVGIANMGLGDSPSLPNLSFEVLGLGPAAATDPFVLPSGAASWTVSFAPPGYSSAPFAAVAAVVKTPAATSNIVFDTSPAFCIADLLTNATYGAAFAPSLVGDLTAYATWCQAAGLAMSAALTEQRPARDILQEWLAATISDAFWSQGQIKIVPYADQAVTGTAADGSPLTFTPALTPVMTIDDTVMLTQSATAGPLQITRKDQAEVNNRVTVEYCDRDNGYNTNTETADDPAHIAAYGLRPAANLEADFITSGAVAQKIADLTLARAIGVLNTYEWRMRSPGELLEPFDVVAVTDAALGLSAYPVRVTAVEEEDDTVFHITAEDIPGLIGATAPRPLAANGGFAANWNADPGDINAPILFEPPDALAVSGTGLELWAAVSGQDTAAWGGCEVWISGDGSSFVQAGTIHGAARQGVLAGPLPAVAAATIPPTIDAADILPVDLRESAGALLPATQADALALNTLCYVDGELLAYQTAELTGASQYALGWLVRGAYATTPSAHAAGSAFARLDGAIFKYPYTADRIGSTVYLKFLSFNVYGGGTQSLAEVEAYAYTLRGAALTSPLPAVQGLSTAYIAGLTQLVWDAVEDFRSPIDYEIRLGPSWNAAQVIGRTPLTQAPILGDGTYWVAAHYAVRNGPDVYSAVPADVEIAGSQLTRNVIATRDEAAEGWPGTFANTGLVDGILTLLGIGDLLAAADVTGVGDVIYYGGVTGSGSYQIAAADRVNIGRVAACNVMITLGAVVGYATNAVDVTQLADVTAVADLLGIDLGNHVWAVPQIRLSQDGTSWGAWQNWIPGSYSAMAFDCQVQLNSSDPGIAAILTDLVFAVDVPDRNDMGTSVAVPAGGLAVAFTAPFNGGPGGSPVPNIQVTILAAHQGDDAIITGVATTGFSVQILNAGAGVARSINWQAQGY